MTPPRYAALITAAGVSRRMRGAIKKEFRMLAGAPVLARALSPFMANPLFGIIAVTVPPGLIDDAREILRPHLETERLLFVEGGETRQESVLRGLEALVASDPQYVLIHDGARPWIGPELIERVAHAAARGACVPVVEVPEAVKQVDDSGAVLSHLPRHTLRFAQTPQGFAFPPILDAHRRAGREGVSCSDDAEVFAHFVGPVAWVPGDIANRKITYTHDLEGQ